MVNRRIRVNPQGVRETAGLLRDKQERLAALGKDLAAAAGDAPSYEGQFGPKVRTLASEGVASLNAVSADVGRAIEELKRIADNFEAADHETQEQLAQFSTGILSHLDGLMALLTQLQSPDGGTYHLRLDYSLEDFEQMSAEERIVWLEAFNDVPGDGWFHNFEDILHYLNDSRVFTGLDGSTPASQWMAWGDAVVLLVVQDGYSLARGSTMEQLAPLPSGIPESLHEERKTAAQSWSEFFVLYQNRPLDTPEHMNNWGLAEQAGVDLGETIAYLKLDQAGVQLSESEQQSIDKFVKFGDAYRWTIGTNSGVEVFEALPRAIGGEIGGGVGDEIIEKLDGLTLTEVESFASLMSIFAGEEAGDFVIGLGNVVVENPLMDDAIDVLATGLGGAAGDLLRDDLQGILDYGGERFFDPRYHWGLDVGGSTPFGEINAELNMRGPLYHISLTVENMLLNGRKDLANRFLEAVEEAAEQAGRPDSQ